MTALVAGAGGFIGGHVARALLGRGVAVRAVDRKPMAEWHQLHRAADNRVLDCSDAADCREAVADCARVYNFAADMGGMGFIAAHKARCMLSVLINTHLLLAARDAGVERYFFASSACVYPAELQREASVTALAEADAYPADPEDGYGWEKLFSERMCRHFSEDFGLAHARCALPQRVRTARHLGRRSREGARRDLPQDRGREGDRPARDRHLGRRRADAQLHACRRLRRRARFGWSDSDVAEPLNVGSDELVTINALVTLVEAIAGIRVRRRYQLAAPLGVRGRNSDNTMIRRRLGWAPGIRLADGLERTYRWISDELALRGASA